MVAEKKKKFLITYKILCYCRNKTSGFLATTNKLTRMTKTNTANGYRLNKLTFSAGKSAHAQ